MNYLFLSPILFTLAVTLSSSVMASEMPFPGVTGESMILGSDKCTARKFLADKITETGINLLDEKIEKTWECKKSDTSPNGTAIGGEPCPYRQYMNSASVTCFSNMTIKYFPAICVGDPRVEKIPMTYGDAGNVIDIRPRFSALHILRKTASGYRADENISMDSNKCERSPTGFDINWKECKDLYTNFATGGPIFRYIQDSPRFGAITGPIDTPEKVHAFLDHFNVVTDLAACKEAYPNMYLERFWLTSNS